MEDEEEDERAVDDVVDMVRAIETVNLVNDDDGNSSH